MCVFLEHDGWIEVRESRLLFRWAQCLILCRPLVKREVSHPLFLRRSPRLSYRPSPFRPLASSRRQALWVVGCNDAEKGYAYRVYHKSKLGLPGLWLNYNLWLKLADFWRNSPKSLPPLLYLPYRVDWSLSVRYTDILFGLFMTVLVAVTARLLCYSCIRRRLVPSCSTTLDLKLIEWSLRAYWFWAAFSVTSYSR